ncbi:hypothetical protein GC176_26180 [bacterium]|nr:hypothetical protein [bacterium]
MTTSLSDRGAFSNRERALEDAFFHKVDAELLAQIRAELHGDDDLEKLAEKTGIRDQKLLQELLEMGLTAENLLVLWLIPLTQVAWADGEIDGNERRAIEAALCEQGFAAESAAARLMSSWLDHRPSEAALEAWREYAVTVLRNADEQRRVQLKHELLARARDVARAAGGFMNLGDVSRAEEAVLREIETALTQ